MLDLRICYFYMTLALALGILTGMFIASTDGPLVPVPSPNEVRLQRDLQELQQENRRMVREIAMLTRANDLTYNQWQESEVNYLHCMKIRGSKP